MRTNSISNYIMFHRSAAILAAFFDPILSLIYPVNCTICTAAVRSAYYSPVCEECWDKTPIYDNSETLCSKCGIFLRHGEQTEIFCRQCSDHHYDKAFAVGIYNDGLSAAVINLKTKPAISAKVKDIIRERLERADLAEIDVIIPVPLSEKRKSERGFNQAEVLATYIGKITGIKVDTASLHRKEHSRIHRAAMDRKARELSVKNAFEVKRPKFITEMTILLVDDLMTSGATASYCSKSLKKAGADKVIVFTLARTGMNYY